MINKETEDKFFRELKDLIIKYKIQPYSLLTLLARFVSSMLNASPDPYNKMLFFINRISLISKSLLNEDQAEPALDDDIQLLLWRSLSQQEGFEDES